MKILSFGEILWDVLGEEKVLGGAPLNLAAHMALQGEEACLASAVGEDALGEEALACVRALHVGMAYVVKQSQYATGQCIVTLGAHGVPSYRLLDGVAYDHVTLPSPLPDQFDLFCFGTLALREAHNRALVTRVLKENCFSEIYADLNIRPPFYSLESVSLCLENATVVKISDEEMPLVTRLLYGEAWEAEEAALRLAKDYPQIKLLLVTQGAKGAFCYEVQKNKYTHCPAAPAEVVSTVGAGDSFGATFLTSYFKTGDVALSLSCAARVSAFVVSRKGAVPDDTAEFVKNTLHLI